MDRYGPSKSRILVYCNRMDAWYVWIKSKVSVELMDICRGLTRDRGLFVDQNLHGTHTK